MRNATILPTTATAITTTAGVWHTKSASTMSLKAGKKKRKRKSNKMKKTVTRITKTYGKEAIE